MQFAAAAIAPVHRLPLRAWAAGTCLTLACLCSVAQGVVVGQVARVHDGDTVTLQQHHQSTLIRLAGIDAPELAQPFGRQAREGLADCSFGRIVVVRVSGTDRHGRMLGTLEAAGQDCGLQQLRAGLAWHYRHFAHEQAIDLRHRYAAAEREARGRGDGLWQQADPMPPWTFRRLNPRFDQRPSAR